MMMGKLFITPTFIIMECIIIHINMFVLVVQKSVLGVFQKEQNLGHRERQDALIILSAISTVWIVRPAYNGEIIGSNPISRMEFLSTRRVLLLQKNVSHTYEYYNSKSFLTRFSNNNSSTIMPTEP